MDGTIKRLRSNPFYIPNDKQGEEMWRAEQEERLKEQERERIEKVLSYEVPEVHDNSLPVHEVKVKRSKKKNG